MNSVLIIGCGDIGRRVARRHLAKSQQVFGLVRSESSAQQAEESGITPIICDLDQANSLTLPQADGVYYFAPPPNEGEDDPRLQKLLDQLSTHPPEALVYISTTGVYGSSDGQWIDEDSPLEAATGRAKRRLNAEQALLAWQPEQAVRRVILRVPGIYGPGRLPAERIRKGLPMVHAEQSPWTNRIHADDLAMICSTALQQAGDGQIFNACDGAPSTMTDYFLKVADHLSLTRPPLVSMQEAAEVLSPAMMSYLSESRRISNRKLLETLQITLSYPDLDAGLKSC